MKLGFWNMTAVQREGSLGVRKRLKTQASNHFENANMYGVLTSC